MVPNTRLPSWPGTSGDRAREKETPKSEREREQRQREEKRRRRSLTGADREVGDVLVPEAVLVGGSVGQQAKSRAADHCHLGPVVRLLQQPLGGQLVVIEGTAAGRFRGQPKFKLKVQSRGRF